MKNQKDKEMSFEPATPNFRTEASKKISKLFPEIVSDGKINFEALKEVLSPDLEIEDSMEKYEFSWRGKRNAKKIADSPARNTTLVANKFKSKNWDTTKNIYIEGDNFEILRLLQKSYSEKVNLIYLDPPYNTGKEFIYHDNYQDSYEGYLKQTGQIDEAGKSTTTNKETDGRFHTIWLNMMYPRLKLARNLLTDDGFIFVSIDDHELKNIQDLLNEIFGSHNFIGIISVENNPKGRKNSSFISVSSEYLVIFAKNKDNSYFVENTPKAASDMKLDENGRYVHGSGKRVIVGDNKFNDYVSDVDSNKNYSVYYDTRNIILRREYSVNSIDKDLIDKGYTRYYSSHNGHLVLNTYTSNKFEELFKNKALEFSNGKIFEKNFSDTIRIKSQLVNRKYDAIVNGNKKKDFNFDLTTTGAGTHLKELFDTNISPFSAPKNVGLLKNIITLIDNKDAIIMDFFSGSSTTAEAVFQQNALDNGNRKFIMIQLPENLDDNLKRADSNSAKNIKSAIKYLESKGLDHRLTTLAEERIRLAGERILSESQSIRRTLDIGFKVYELQESTIHQWDENPAKFEEQLKLFKENIFTEDSTNEQRAQEIALKSGISLDVNPEITGDIYHFVAKEKEVFVVLGDYDNELLKVLNSSRKLNIATVILHELLGGSEVKFNLLEEIKQDEDLNNHFNLEWL